MDRQSGTAAAAEDDYNHNVDISNSNQCTDCRMDDFFLSSGVGMLPWRMNLMLVPLVCFVHLLHLLMKLNTIKEIQLFCHYKASSVESVLFQLGLIIDGIFISKWQITTFLLISNFSVHNNPHSPIWLPARTFLNFSSIQFVSDFV